MTLRELNAEQRHEQKEAYLQNKRAKEGNGVSWGEMADADDLVTDTELEIVFGNVKFSRDDFLA